MIFVRFSTFDYQTAEDNHWYFMYEANKEALDMLEYAIEEEDTPFYYYCKEDVCPLFVDLLCEKLDNHHFVIGKILPIHRYHIKSDELSTYNGMLEMIKGEEE